MKPYLSWSCRLAERLSEKRHLRGGLDMVRDQIITVEVNIARVFNHDVVRRRQAKGEVGVS